MSHDIACRGRVLVVLAGVAFASVDAPRLQAQAAAAAPVLKPMAADANPAFEVATIKPSDPNAQGKGFGLRGHNFSATNHTVNDLIMYAYGVQVKQIVDGPDWLGKDHFDIAAVPDAEGQPSAEQWKTMVQKLMADRFRLTFHHEKRELSVFALTVGKNGPKLTKNESHEPPNGGLNMQLSRDGFVLVGRNETMTGFASALQEAVLDRPVVDQTGLAGRFDFQFTFAPDGSQFGGMSLPVPTDGSSPAPSLFTAIQEIGLKLDAVKIPTDVIVIDHIEMPSEN